MPTCHRQRPTTLACVVAVAISACGGDVPPAPQPTPSPEPSPVAKPSPEPAPADLAPALLFHLVVEEEIAAPDLPTRSPLARDLPPLPDGPPGSELLADEGAAEPSIEALRALEAGYGPPGGALLVVRWDVAWGPDGRSGRTRRWGVCALPCTIEDEFVSGPQNHPVHPVLAPRALFAHRPGAQDVRVERQGEGLRVVHGDAVLWDGDHAGDPARGERADAFQTMAADGVTLSQATLASRRVLRAVSVERRSVDLTGRSDALPDRVRVLPRLGVDPDAPRRLAVEGVRERWPWPEGTSLGGGFTVRPSPDADGIKLDRVRGELRWYPTAGQAGDGKAVFPTYALSGPGASGDVAPFPDGADVLGGTKAVGNRVVVAAGIDFEAERRARQVADMFEQYQGILPMPGEAEDGEVQAVVAMEGPSPWVVYVAPDATGVVPGSAGERPQALAVDDDLDEQASVARAWVRLVLPRRPGPAGPALLDFEAWALGKLVREHPDRSVFMHVFSEAGEDVAEVWSQWLADPAREGPDPAAFVAFVEGQLPDLAEGLRRSLAARRFEVAPPPSPVEPVPGSKGADVVAGDPGPEGTAVAVRLPAGAQTGPVQVRVVPQTGRGAVHWAAALVEERWWDEAGRAQEARADLLSHLGPTRGIDAPAAGQTPPPAPPSQLRGQFQGARVVTRPVAAEPQTETLAPQPQAVGSPVALVLLWGEPGWKARIEVAGSVAMPQPEPSPDASPAGAPSQPDAGPAAP